jgi:hypothetical protein
MTFGPASGSAAMCCRGTRDESSERMEDAVRDLYGGYRLAQERAEALRAEAARERFARSFDRAERSVRPERASMWSVVGGLLIRTGRALGGDHGTGRPAHTAPSVLLAQLSRNASRTGTPTPRRRTRRHDRLDRLARDLEGLARELTAGEAVEL